MPNMRRSNSNRMEADLRYVGMKVTGHPPVTASPLDERRGSDEELFRFTDEEAYFSVRRREATRKATKPIAKGRAVTK